MKKVNEGYYTYGCWCDKGMTTSRYRLKNKLCKKCGQYRTMIGIVIISDDFLLKDEIGEL